MRKMGDITGIILAGGKSSRMGTEKGMIPFKGKPFIGHIIDSMRPLVSNIIIVSDSQAYDHLNLNRYEDLIKNTGPLAGLYTGLSHSTTEFNLVLSCDMPLVRTEMLKNLINPEYHAYDIVQYQSQGEIIPLMAVYKKNCSSTCKKLIDQGERRLLTLGDHLNTRTLILDPIFEKYADNINTKEQLNMINHESDR